MKLGTLLLRDAVISLNQLEAALRAQVLYGGRLGTNLVELGFISVNLLGEYLGSVLDVPVATADRLDRVGPNIILQFGADLADLYTAFPLGPSSIKPGGLDVAMADPLDELAIEQLSTQCGRQVIPHVAAELRILYYLEKHYGIVRKARYLRESGEGRAHGNERRRLHPAAPKVPKKVRFEPKKKTPRSVAVPPIESIETTTPSAAVPPPQSAGPPTPRVQFLDSCAALAAAKNRDRIADAIVEYAVGRFGVAVVLLLRSANAVGWRLYAHDTAGARDAVEKLSLPLNASSVFQAAHDAAHPYRGGPTSAGRPIEKQLWDAVGVDHEPEDMLVVPVLVRARVVNLIYAHGIDGGPIDNDYAGEMSELGHRASDAYVRLIREAKASARAQTEGP